MTKKEEIVKIWEEKLEIRRYADGKYQICDKKVDLFIHADILTFGELGTDTQGWLYLYNRGRYTGSIWINIESEVKAVRQFLEE